MKHCDYADVKRFLHDDDLIRLLCVDRPFECLLECVARDDFLVITDRVKIPFFAETRDYIGAVEKDDPGGVWIVKPVSGGDVLKTEMATVCFLLDFYTGTLSAPLVITRIGGSLYKATKLIPRAEQLSGANYTELKQLKEQLLLDVINRWIYFDEDRNPNNYLVKYNSRNDQIVVAIDFLNADLVSEEMKIVGTAKRFGWERKEKTRYLTPLQCQNCLEYDMAFFGMRMKKFKSLNFPFLKEVCLTIFKKNSEGEKLSRVIADNLLKRIEYVDGYFRAHIRAAGRDSSSKKYREMGKSFARFYGK
jgi:hypothetical protein